MTFGFTNSWHGDHEEVDTVPVRQLDSICEIWRVPAVFELKLKISKSWIYLQEKCWYQVYDARSSEPDRDKDGYELGKSAKGEVEQKEFCSLSPYWSWGF